MEAYCLGAPIVTSNIEATREICETDKGVWYADHRDTNATAEAIISCADSSLEPALQEQIKNRNLPRFSEAITHELWRRMWLV